MASLLVLIRTHCQEVGLLVLLRTQARRGCASGESGAEEIPRSDLACGDLACGEVAGFSGNYSESGSNTIFV